MLLLLQRTLIVGDAARGGTDTNVAGANGTIQSGLGTGNATGSKSHIPYTNSRQYRYNSRELCN